MLVLQRSEASLAVSVGEGAEAGSSCGSHVPMGTDWRCKGLNSQLRGDLSIKVGKGFDF